MDEWEGREDLSKKIYNGLVSDTDCPGTWNSDKPTDPDQSIKNLKDYVEWLIQFLRKPIIVAAKVDTELELMALQGVFEGMLDDRRHESVMTKVFWLIDYSKMYQAYLGVAEKCVDRWKLNLK